MSVLGCYSVSVCSNYSLCGRGGGGGGIGANISDTAVFRAKLGRVLMVAGYFQILLVLYLSLKEFFVMPAKHVGNHTQLQVLFCSVHYCSYIKPVQMCLAERD